MHTLVDRKRKRRGQVRFCAEPCEIIDTYSQAEYDRGGLFPDTVNNNIILTLSFGFMTPPPPAPPPPLDLPMKTENNNKKRPKLSIDTSKIHDGPLYFTSMTTNHQKKEQQQQDDDRITMENTEINRRCLVAAV
ncbi:hypothetical protein BC941DRAFT_424005 [Chlamydoabsidia padenii]|nr:hypothetical protein BC941DRAFT_424005 [Chlamydoabsidia padenii]